MPACPKLKPVRDRKYRERARHMRCRVRTCYITGESGKVVLAHIRRPYNCGTGLKPPDSHSLYLCSEHHVEFDTSPDRCAWLVDNIMIPECEGDYHRWKLGTGQ